ncbi:MAG TPA: DUF3667 domain-containing protein [Fulvivirga sp.]|nr:DUF3667 domain-containing protein [Fulvivirga sp.]
MSETSCPNCEQEIIGAFCHHCGQKKNVYRLTWRGLFDDLQKRLFGFDNNFFRTIKDLTIRPEKVIQSNIDGIRVRYIGPVGYYFLLVTIFVLIISMLNIDMMQYTKDINSAFSSGTSEKQAAMQSTFQGTIFENFRTVGFLMAPFFIIGVWIMFRNKKYNLLENAVLVFYAQGHPMLLSFLGLFLYKFAGMTHAIAFISPIGILYFSWVCARFFKGNGIWNFIKGLLAYILGMLTLMLIVITITAVIAALFPEVFML